MPLRLPTDRRVKNVHSLRSDIVFAFICLAGLYLAIQAIDVLLLIYVSALFAVVISPAIRLIRRLKVGGWRPGRGLAIGVLLVSLLSGFVFFALFRLPPIIRHAHDFAPTSPRRMADRR